MKRIYFHPSMTFVATLFLIILLPIYWYYYGPQNFLWLSDIGLFLTVAALWLQAPVLMNSACVGILPQEIAWNIDFFTGLLTGYHPVGLSDYMFDEKLPLFLRALSLFHILMPLIWLWCIITIGYNPKAAWYSTIMIWCALICTYFFTQPADNINWMFMAQAHQWQFVSPFAWFLFLMIGIPLFIILPMHLLLCTISKKID